MIHTKKQNQIYHATKRAKKRFDLDLKREDFIDIVNNIKNKKDSFCIEKQSNRIFIYAIKYKNNPYKIVYDSKRKTVVTFLTFNTEKSFEDLKLELDTEKNNFDISINNELFEIWGGY